MRKRFKYMKLVPRIPKSTVTQKNNQDSSEKKDTPALLYNSETTSKFLPPPENPEQNEIDNGNSFLMVKYLPVGKGDVFFKSECIKEFFAFIVKYKTSVMESSVARNMFLDILERIGDEFAIFKTARSTYHALISMVRCTLLNELGIKSIIEEETFFFRKRLLVVSL